MREKVDQLHCLRRTEGQWQEKQEPTGLGWERVMSSVVDKPQAHVETQAREENGKGNSLSVGQDGLVASILRVCDSKWQF